MFDKILQLFSNLGRSTYKKFITLVISIAFIYFFTKLAS